MSYVNLRSTHVQKNFLIRSKFLHRHINWFSEVYILKNIFGCIFHIENSIFFFNAPLVEYTLTLMYWRCKNEKPTWHMELQ